MHAIRHAGIASLAVLLLLPATLLAQGRGGRGGGGQASLTEAFVGVTADGTVEAGLFPIRSTGVSTAPVAAAARAFLGALTADQRSRTEFPVDDLEWRMWANQHSYVRQGVGFDEMSEAQRQAAFAFMGEALSAKGLELSRDIMRLNHTLGEMNDDNFEEYGEWLYWITVMGEPSETEPWGWQLDGHHLVINYFVLGDQVVMTPAFWGSEPVIATTGKYAGTSILQAEQDAGLAMRRSLDATQVGRAVLNPEKTGNNAQTQAFRDNVVLDYEGIPGAALNDAQKEQLLGLIGLYVSNLRDEHAAVQMDDVRAHIDRTHFAWVGGDQDDSAYYYRIHSPVILIEFDHQNPVGLRGQVPSGPNREHIHAVVRTPNGNDYGKDLLRQHLMDQSHAPGSAHVGGAGTHTHGGTTHSHGGGEARESPAR